jgi:N-methylhydantoinase A
MARFHDEHERAYGFKAPQETVELVNVRVSAVGAIAKPCLREIGSQGTAADAARTATRPGYFAEAGGYVACPGYDRYRLGAGCSVAGPAVVQEIDSTTLLHPGYRAEVDRLGNLLIRKRQEDAPV